MSRVEYGQLLPDAQDQKGVLLGNPLSTVVTRSVQIFAFWFVIVLIVGFVYNEVVVSETMRQWTGNPSNVEYESVEEEAVMNTDFDKYRYDNHQIMSFAGSVAVVMLLVRFFLEWLCFYVSKEVCANVSGQAIYTESSYRQDDNRPQPQAQPPYAIQQPQAPQMTREEMYAPPDSLDGGVNDYPHERRRHH